MKYETDFRDSLPSVEAPDSTEEALLNLVCLLESTVKERNELRERNAELEAELAGRTSP